MKKRKALLIILTLMIIVMAVMFTACDYGQPDKLNIGKISGGERVLIGLQVALIGLVMVFVVLFMLIGFIKIIRYLCMYLEGDKKISFKKKNKNALSQEGLAGADMAASEDDEIAVAITAALIAYYENQNVGCVSELPFKVRSIKQIKNKI